MVFDELTKLANVQAFTADAPTTKSYDAGNPTIKPDLTPRDPTVVLVHTDVAAAATGTYEWQAIQSVNADLPAPDILVARTIAAPSDRGNNARTRHSPGRHHEEISRLPSERRGRHTERHGHHPHPAEKLRSAVENLYVCDDRQ